MQMRKVPMRMCTGCCQMKPKRELVRVVKSQDGEISLDLTRISLPAFPAWAICT